MAAAPTIAYSDLFLRRGRTQLPSTNAITDIALILHSQPDEPAGTACANTKHRDKNAGQDLDAKCYSGERSLNDECDRDHPHD